MGDPYSLPSLPLEDWKQTKITLHLFAQIVGKVRLALAPRLNHWWHVPFYVSSRGLTTSAIPYGGRNVEIELGFLDHRLRIATSDGRSKQIPLASVTVAELYRALITSLEELGIEVAILARPFDPDRVGSAAPFATDTSPREYDPEFAQRFWRILVQVEGIFQKFRGRFLGKCSPVHFFWHSFDLACTRFSGRRAPVMEGADAVTREAYSHEVISAGFWPGDAKVPYPAFYAYVHPEPEGLADEPLRPHGASWQSQNGSSMALLAYEDVRQAADPEAALLSFLESSYEAGARLARWPREELERS